MKHTEKLAEFSWVLLETVPKWNDVDKSSRVLIEKGMFDSNKHQKLFHAFGFLEKYMDEDRIKEIVQHKVKKLKRNEKRKSIAMYWVDFFEAMEKLAVDYTPLDELVSYALSNPGNFLILTPMLRILSNRTNWF